MATRHRKENESLQAREKRLSYAKDYARQYARRNPEKRAAYGRNYRERLKNGEITLPPLDWAICERGGSAAQATAHRRRKEKPCDSCLRAEREAKARREIRKKELLSCRPELSTSS